MNELTCDLPDAVDPDEAKFLLSTKLYEKGHLSLGQAARFAGYTRPEYIDMLGEEGIPVYDYPADELEHEMNLDE